MKYQYFIEAVTDKRRGSYDLFIMVPVLRASSSRLRAWSAFVSDNDLHAYLSIPMDDTRIRFQILVKKVNGKKYPVLRLKCSRYGTFTIPFEPNKAGLHHLQETYKGVKTLFEEKNKTSRISSQKRNASQSGATAVTQKEIPMQVRRQSKQPQAKTPTNVVPMTPRKRAPEKTGVRLKRTMVLGCFVGTSVIAALHISGAAALENSALAARGTGIIEDHGAPATAPVKGLPLPEVSAPLTAKQTPPCTVGTGNTAVLSALRAPLKERQQEESAPNQEAPTQ